jgi:hypothetical protein
VHDFRHTYASLARRAGADLRLLQKTMGHASITMTAHISADLYDDELDDIASALDALDSARGDLPYPPAGSAETLAGYWPDDLESRRTNEHHPGAKTMNWAFGGGPGWFRTSDLPRVRRTLSH